MISVQSLLCAVCEIAAHARTVRIFLTAMCARSLILSCRKKAAFSMLLNVCLTIYFDFLEQKLNVCTLVMILMNAFL